METLLTGSKFVIPLVALGAATLFFFGGCRHHRGEYHGRCGHDPERFEEAVRGHLSDVLDDLDATPEQRTQISAAIDHLLPQVRDLAGERQQIHDDLRAAWEQDTLDPAPLHELVDRRSEEFTRVAHEAVSVAAELHGILTPEQRARVADRWERKRCR